jgi:hypothetical protein
MGYTTRFKLKGELDQEFKPRLSSAFSNKQKEESILKGVCMLNGFHEPNDYFSLGKIYDNISFAVKSYANVIEDEWRESIAERAKDEDGIQMCGYEYSRGRFGDYEVEDEYYLDYVIAQLFSISIQKTDSKWEKDTKYYEKEQEIFDIVHNIEDTVWTHMDYQFIKRYRDSEDAVEIGDDTEEDNCKESPFE